MRVLGFPSTTLEFDPQNVSIAFSKTTKKKEEKEGEKGEGEKEREEEEKGEKTEEREKGGRRGRGKEREGGGERGGSYNAYPWGI